MNLKIFVVEYNGAAVSLMAAFGWLMAACGWLMAACGWLALLEASTSRLSPTAPVSRTLAHANS